MRQLLLLLFILILIKYAPAQTNTPQKPCSSAECSQFDFWVGDWNLTWNDTSKGTNTVNRVLDGCAVQENFYDPTMNYRGMSWSMYNPKTAIWQQTWVDNQGGYIVLTGKFEKGEMILVTKPAPFPKGKQTISRMLYYNIKPESFDWSWESSPDNGGTWKPSWQIHYQRRK